MSEVIGDAGEIGPQGKGVGWGSGARRLYCMCDDQSC